MQKSNLFSVIVPAHNEEQYIGKCLKAIRAAEKQAARKFDQFGDWYLLKDRKLTKAIFTGKDRAAADRFYYDAK